MTHLLLGTAAMRCDTDGLPAAVRVGADTHRLPVSWAHLQPAGRGDLDAGAVARVAAVLDRLREAGVLPTLVLHRGDLPPVGVAGWGERAAAEAFAGYARAVARALGSRVDLWTTFDEPPPGRASAVSLAAAHHRVLAHSLAALAIREELPDARISFSVAVRVTRPEDESDSTHLEAVGEADLLHNHLYLSPLLEGSYPTDLVADTRHLCDWSFVRGGDLVTARQRLDVLQVTYRDTAVVRRAGGAVEEVVPRVVDPRGLTDLLQSLDTVFPGVPLIACTTSPAGADLVSYHAGHLARVEQAAADGVDVRGHVVLQDDAEWPGPLADWYAGVVARHRDARAVAEAAAVVVEPAPRGFLRRLRRRGS